MTQKEIYTIDARDNKFYDILKQQGVPMSDIGYSIMSAFDDVKGLLKEKGVEYKNLKNALFPHANKEEMCLFFDAGKTTNSSIYGREIAKRVLPFLKNIKICSVLDGDYVVWDSDGENAVRDLEKSMKISNHTELTKTRIYCVYINNLTETMCSEIGHGLSDYPAYIGYANMTRTSVLKWRISRMLPVGFVKYGNVVIMGHEDDRDHHENVNMTLFPFEEQGIEMVSIQGLLFSTFLSYKIETPVFLGFETDEEVALAILGDYDGSLDNYSVEIDDRKFEYIQDKKYPNLQNAEIEVFDKDKVIDLVKNSLRSNYIFNLKEAPDGARCFATIIEIPRKGRGSYRLSVAMKLNYIEKTIKVTTLY